MVVFDVDHGLAVIQCNLRLTAMVLLLLAADRSTAGDGVGTGDEVAEEMLSADRNCVEGECPAIREFFNSGRLSGAAGNRAYASGANQSGGADARHNRFGAAVLPSAAVQRCRPGTRAQFRDQIGGKQVFRRRRRKAGSVATAYRRHALPPCPEPEGITSWHFLTWDAIPGKSPLFELLHNGEGPLSRRERRRPVEASSWDGHGDDR
jgi:hypothetical protein